MRGGAKFKWRDGTVAQWRLCNGAKFLAEKQRGAAVAQRFKSTVAHVAVARTKQSGARPALLVYALYRGTVPVKKTRIIQYVYMFSFFL